MSGTSSLRSEPSARRQSSGVANGIKLPVLTCGVYVVFATDCVVYVGRSYSIAYRRIGAAVARFSEKYALSGIEFYACSTREDAHRLEGELIQRLQPAENVQRRSRKRRQRNRMSSEEELHIYEQVSAIVKEHGTTMKRVDRIMGEMGQRNVEHR